MVNYLARATILPSFSPHRLPDSSSPISSATPQRILDQGVWSSVDPLSVFTHTGIPDEAQT